MGVRDREVGGGKKGWVNKLVATEGGVGRTCAGAAAERVDAEREGCLDGENQGEHDPACVGRARGQLRRRWEAGASRRAGRDRGEETYVEELSTRHARVGGSSG